MININKLLNEVKAPKQLREHLAIVNEVSLKLIDRITSSWPEIKRHLDKELILDGAEVHDIGKAIHQEELYKPGERHEQAGYELLKKLGYDESICKFAKLYDKGNRTNINYLIVMIADIIWKGSRNDEIETLLCNKISEIAHLKTYQVWLELDCILERISKKGLERLLK